MTDLVTDDDDTSGNENSQIDPIVAGDTDEPDPDTTGSDDPEDDDDT